MSRLANAITKALGDLAVHLETPAGSTLSVCTVPLEHFASAARAVKAHYGMLAAQWAADETTFGRGYAVYACYRWSGEYLIVNSEIPLEDSWFPSITKEFVPAYRFERQIESLFGIRAKGNQDKRPWIKFEDWPQDTWPLRKTFDISTPIKRVEGSYAWARAEGEGVYEIPVGPVHAGIIEPGHFRFQAVGERVLNLEERLGYVHKGIEKKFETLSWHEGARLAGRVSGDSTVAHALTYCMALESMTGCAVPQRAHYLRAIFLERERIANHLGDIGAICNDASFAIMLYQLMRLKEIVLRTNGKLFAHRFMMDKVVPGGVSVDIDAEGASAMLAELEYVSDEFERLVKIYDENSSMEDRARETGILRPEKAHDLCVVGVVARASGLNLDCRLFNPFPPYDLLKNPELDVPVLISGDVHARLWVRVIEIRESMKLIRWMLGSLPKTPTLATCEAPSAGATGFAAVEGWRGEVIYWLQAGPCGEVSRVMPRDPSSLNWLGLEQAMPGNIVPDFPLCNKSFNQSYSGHDL